MLQAKTGRTWYKHFIQEYGQWSSNGKGHLILSTYPFDSTGYTTITAVIGSQWCRRGGAGDDHRQRPQPST